MFTCELYMWASPATTVADPRDKQVQEQKTKNENKGGVHVDKAIVHRFQPLTAVVVEP